MVHERYPVESGPGADPARQRRRFSAVARHVLGLEGAFLTSAQVAEQLQVSVWTVRRIARQAPQQAAPSQVTSIGSRVITLYTPEDVGAIANFLHRRGHAPGARGGRRQLWSVAESTDRRARQLRASYCQRRAAQLQARGEPAQAQVYVNERRLLLADLAAQTQQRRVELARLADATPALRRPRRRSSAPAPR